MKSVLANGKLHLSCYVLYTSQVFLIIFTIYMLAARTYKKYHDIRCPKN
jgi:hypothetical protein